MTKFEKDLMSPKVRGGVISSKVKSASTPKRPSSDKGGKRETNSKILIRSPQPLKQLAMKNQERHHYNRHGERLHN